MDGYRISEVAERTGFTPSALRFYEDAGLVTPARTASGYRSYDDRSLDTLRFIGRGKQLGLSLDEITELVSLYADDRCEPVQHRLRAMVDEKIADAQLRVAELVGFTADLQKVAARLGDHTPDGACDDRCGCTNALVPAPIEGTLPPSAACGCGSSTCRDAFDAGDVVGVALSSSAPDAVPIVCTLGGLSGEDAIEAGLIRIGEWQAVVAWATAREAIEGGLRLVFPREVDLSPIAELAAAEQECCNFFRFAIAIETDHVTLDVTGPVDAAPVIEAFIGVAP